MKNCHLKNHTEHLKKLFDLHTKMDEELVPLPVAQVNVDQEAESGLPAADFSAPLLIDKVNAPAARQWYMRAALDNGWSRCLLQDHLQAANHQRVDKAASNFSLRLLAPDSALVQQTLKDPYLFDFLMLDKKGA